MARISPDFAAEVTTNPAYYVRDEDVFVSTTMGELDKETMGKVFDKFKGEILELSFRTRIFKFVRDLYGRIGGANALQSVDMRMSLTINVWPFNFTVMETEELIAQTREFLGNVLDVEVINFNPADIKLDYALDKYVAMIFYDNYALWFNANQEAITRRKRIQEISFYVPRLYTNGKPSEASLREFKRYEADPFDAWEQAYKPFMNINYLPISFFCVDLPSNPEELTDQLIQ